MPVLKVGSTGDVKFPFRSESIQELLKKFNQSNDTLAALHQDRGENNFNYVKKLGESHFANKNRINDLLSANANRGTALSSNYAKQRAALAQQFNNALSELNIGNQQFKNTDRMQQAGVVTDYNDLIRMLSAEETGYSPEKAAANELVQKQVRDANALELTGARSEIATANQQLKAALMNQLLGVKDEANADLGRLGHGNVDLASNFGEYANFYKSLIDQTGAGDLGMLTQLLRNEAGKYAGRGGLIPEISQQNDSGYGYGGGFGGGFAPFGGGYGFAPYGFEPYGYGGGYSGGYGPGPERDAEHQALINETMKNYAKMPNSLLGGAKDPNPEAGLIDDRRLFPEQGYVQELLRLAGEDPTPQPMTSSSRPSAPKPGTDTGSIRSRGATKMSPRQEEQARKARRKKLRDKDEKARKKVNKSKTLNKQQKKTLNEYLDMPRGLTEGGRPKKKDRDKDRDRDDDNDTGSIRKRPKKQKPRGRSGSTKDRYSRPKPKPRRRPGNTGSANAADREREKKEEKKKSSSRRKKSTSSRRKSSSSSRRRSSSRSRSRSRSRRKTYRGRRRGPG